MDSSEEVASCLVISSSDGSKELKLSEEVFNEMASFVEFLVVFALYLAIRLGRNHGNFAHLLPGNQDPLVGVEAFVGKQNVSFQLRQQHIGSFQIAGLSAGEMKSNGVAKSVYGGVNFGAQPAFAASDGLV